LADERRATQGSEAVQRKKAITTDKGQQGRNQMGKTFQMNRILSSVVAASVAIAFGATAASAQTYTKRGQGTGTYTKPSTQATVKSVPHVAAPSIRVGEPHPGRYEQSHHRHHRWWHWNRRWW